VNVTIAGDAEKIARGSVALQTSKDRVKQFTIVAKTSSELVNYA